MTANKQPAEYLVKDMRQALTGIQGCLAGSAVTAVTYDKLFAYDDIDIFVYSNSSLIQTVESLRHLGFEFQRRNDELKYRRWMSFDSAQWKTNTLHMSGSVDPIGDPFDVNITFKKIGGHPMSQLYMVLGTFDFGLTMTGWDLQFDTWHDMRLYFWGADADMDQLPLSPFRESRLREGLITDHETTRQPGRYAKYQKTYGYNLWKAKAPLVTGYQLAAEHSEDSPYPDKKALAPLQYAIGNAIETDDYDSLLQMDATLRHHGGVDELMEAFDA